LFDIRYSLHLLALSSIHPATQARRRPITPTSIWQLHRRLKSGSASLAVQMGGFAVSVDSGNRLLINGLWPTLPVWHVHCSFVGSSGICADWQTISETPYDAN